MENASKALLIAGAVLIVIMLIGLGISIYNSSNGISNHSKDTGDIMSLKMKIAAIELQFSKYKGNKDGKEVRDMQDELIKYNNENKDEKICVTYTAKDKITRIGPNNINRMSLLGKRYNVSMGENKEIIENITGEIRGEKIEENNYIYYIRIEYVSDNN